MMVFARFNPALDDAKTRFSEKRRWIFEPARSLISALDYMRGIKPAGQRTLVGDGEIAFTVADGDAVRATQGAWKARGAKIAQAHTFVALDPDGHRVRVFAPAA